MRCPLCGREMARLPGSDARRVSQPIYYCEKHGVLNKPADPRDKTTEIVKRTQWLPTD